MVHSAKEVWGFKVYSGHATNQQGDNHKQRSGPILDDVVEVFARHAIYYMGNFYLGYDQFQLASKNKDVKTMKTMNIPLGLYEDVHITLRCF